MSRLVFACLVLTLTSLLGVSTRAAAHPLAPSLLEIEEVEPDAITARWKRPTAVVSASPAAMRLPRHCGEPRRLRRAVEGTAMVELSEAMCPGGLTGHDVSIAGIGDSKANVVLRVSLADGRGFTSVLTPDTPTFSIPAKEKSVVILGDYVTLGFQHILAGWDHMLFLVGLLLLSRGLRSLLLMVTMFTVGHSVTLTCAMLGWVRVPSTPVEILIAFSIGLLAWDVLKSKPRGGAEGVPGQSRFLWVMALGFGLLHGLGFAGALAEIGLPVGDIPLALFSFNVGIELGQLLLVAGILSAFAVVSRVPLTRALAAPGTRLVAYAMGTLSVYWILERSESLVGF